MTMLVATLGLLSAALSHDIGSDSQRPFAVVIVGGLIADLAMSIFMLPTLYVWIARDRDKLPEPEPVALRAKAAESVNFAIWCQFPDKLRRLELNNGERAFAASVWLLKQDSNLRPLG
jgi:hypothetical protein